MMHNPTRQANITSLWDTLSASRKQKQHDEEDGFLPLFDTNKALWELTSPMRLLHSSALMLAASMS